MSECVLKQEFGILEKNLPEWLKTHYGKWVLIKADEVIDFYDTRALAFEEAQKRFGTKTAYFVHEIKPLTVVRVTTIRPAR